jgi:predicted nucleic acid-binding protein
MISNGGQGWATCPITELGCARVVAGPAFGSMRVPVARAIERLAEVVQDERHVFWPDDVSILADTSHHARALLHGPGQLTDRYLLELAAAHGGTLATFDRAMATALPSQSPLLAHLEIIAG